MCVSKNEDGIFVFKSTYTRHRKRAQILSSQDDENIDQVKVHDQDFHENIIENIDDIEDFDDFDNLEIISDNKEEEEGDDDISSQEDEEEEEEDNDNIDKDEDDNSEDSDDNKDEIQIEDHNIISEEVIEGLKLLYLKSLFNLSEVAYYGINEAYVKKDLSLYKVKKSLERIIGFVLIFYNMCENSCIHYTGIYESFQSCLLCSSSRYDNLTNKSKKVMLSKKIRNPI